MFFMLSTAEAPKLKHFPGNITFEIDDDPLPKSAETHPRPPIIPTKLNPGDYDRFYCFR